MGSPLRDSSISGVRATTRGLPHMEIFTPEAPHTISGQRYQFDFERGAGDNIGLISSLSIYAGVDEYGFLTTPYRRVEKAKVLN